MGLVRESNIQRIDDDLSYLQKANLFDKGRNEVLRMVARNEGL